MMTSTGARRPRTTRSLRQPFHAANDSPPHRSRASRCLCPSGMTPITPNTGRLTSHARCGTLRERCGLKERLERAAHPAGVGAGAVRGDHGFIDLRHSPLIARDGSRRPFFQLAGTTEEGRPRQRERDRAGRSHERPLSHAIAVASSEVTALVGARPQRGSQVLLDSRLDRDADMPVDQFAERDRLKLLRPRIFLDTLAHGAFVG
jgi:hypothetical protein